MQLYAGTFRQSDRVAKKKRTIVLEQALPKRGSRERARERSIEMSGKLQIQTLVSENGEVDTSCLLRDQ